MASDLDEFEFGEFIPGEALRLYIYTTAGEHGGGKWFRSSGLDVPEDGLSFEDARRNEAFARSRGLETRVTDTLDKIVFMSIHGVAVYCGDFWDKV